MSFQFAHMELYSAGGKDVSKTVRYVISEAKREAGNCPHVSDPLPPVKVYGMSLDALEALHDDKVKNAKTTNAKGKTRAIRKDQKTLCTIVLSHPGADGGPDIASVQEWQEKSLQWLHKLYGDNLKTVVRHDDESHPHLHCYILPDDDEMRASALHPGLTARYAFDNATVRKDPEARKTANKLGDRAYKEAMREWQDSYYEDVGISCGLARIGPGKRRLTRAAWRNEQGQATRARNVLNNIDTVEKRCHDMEESAKANTNIAQQMLADARKALTDADTARENADSQAKTIIAKAKRQAREIIKKAQRPSEIIKNAWAKLTGQTERKKLGFAFDEGKKAGHAERQADVDAANARADRERKNAENIGKELKREREDRAKDFVVPPREQVAYAEWKAQQRTKNAPAGPERKKSGYDYE